VRDEEARERAEAAGAVDPDASPVYAALADWRASQRFAFIAPGIAVRVGKPSKWSAYRRAGKRVA